MSSYHGISLRDIRGREQGSKTLANKARRIDSYKDRLEKKIKVLEGRIAGIQKKIDEDFAIAEDAEDGLNGLTFADGDEAYNRAVHSGFLKNSMIAELEALRANLERINTNPPVEGSGRSKKKWIQEAVKDMKEGAFTKQAKRKGESAMEYAEEVLAHPEKHTLTTRRRAQFAVNVAGKKKSKPSGRMKGGVLNSEEQKEFAELQRYRASLREQMNAISPPGVSQRGLHPDAKAQYKALQREMAKTNRDYDYFFRKLHSAEREYDTSEMPSLPRSVEQTPEASLNEMVFDKPSAMDEPRNQMAFKNLKSDAPEFVPGQHLQSPMLGSGLHGGVRMDRDAEGNYVVLSGKPEKAVASYRTAKEALEHMNMLIKDERRMADMASRLTHKPDEGYDAEVASLLMPSAVLKNPSITKKLNFGSGKVRFSPEAYFME